MILINCSNCSRKKEIHPSGKRTHNFCDKKCMGAFYRINNGDKQTTHGMSKTRFFSIYSGMKARCVKKNCSKNKNYGWKGIKVEWPNFESFRDDMYEEYLEHVEKHGEKDTTIDRVDSGGNYNKENCRWATVKQQANNTSTNIVIEHEGKKMTLTQWAEYMGVAYTRLRQRIQRWGYEKALATKSTDLRCIEYAGTVKTVREWSKITGICIATLQSRRARGWKDEKIISTPLNIKMSRKII